MYKYYQPNKFDIKDKYGDCVVRALSKAFNMSWMETFEATLPFMIKHQCIVNALPLNLEKELMKEFGFTYVPISNKKGTKRPTVATFSKEHKKGTYVLSIANHRVTCVDGDYYDTWDCGYKSLYGYFEKNV